MTTREQIVAAARGWIDTPFAHQRRAKGVGVDCVGVVIMVAQELGLSTFDTCDYGRAPDPDAMRTLLEAHLDYVAFRDVLPGDILWLRVPEPQHLAIVTAADPLQMVHAFRRVGKVVEVSVDRVWRSKRLVACFRFRGLA